MIWRAILFWLLIANLALADFPPHSSVASVASCGNSLFQYDAANRLTNTISPTGKTTGRVFNNRGLLYTVTDALRQTTTFSNDAKGRMTNRNDSMGNTGYLLDLNNSVIAVTNVGSGSGLSWGYDAYDRPVGCTNAAGFVIQYRYDNNGNLTSLIYPGSLTVNYSYDALNRLTSVTDWAGRQTTNTYDFGARIDPNRAAQWNAPHQRLRCRGSDDEHRGVLFNRGDGGRLFRIELQHGGARGVEFVAPLPHTFTPPSRTMTCDNDNRLATFNGTNVTVDNDGNLTYVQERTTRF